jgi:hypothetical protein
MSVAHPNVVEVQHEHPRPSPYREFVEVGRLMNYRTEIPALGRRRRHSRSDPEGHKTKFNLQMEPLFLNMSSEKSTDAIAATRGSSAGNASLVVVAHLGAA